MDLKYAYYPGCVIFGTGKEYDISAREVAKKLGIELVEIPDWSCCGASVSDSFNKDLFYFLQARNIAKAEELGLDIVAICNECFNNLKQGNERLKKHAELREKTNEALKKIGLEFKGKANVKHFLEVIVNDYGIERLKEKIKEEKPLKNLRVAPYYGCLALRPSEVSIDLYENPKLFEKLLSFLGADVVKFNESKSACCGSAVMFADETVSLKLSSQILKNAKKKSAACIATMCPLCHLNLDLKQKRIEKLEKEEFKMPVIYFTQLLGLALAIEPKKLGLNKNIVSTKKVIAWVMS